MEILEYKIKEFLAISDSRNFEHGDGSGSGPGFGFCDGSGDGSGYGFGDCDGNGFGFGSGSGFGHGLSDGLGLGSGYGRGFGSGNGCDRGYGLGRGFGIEKFNNKQVYAVDGIPTILTHIKNNVAKGFILNKDLTLDKCYVVKRQDLFVHGKTIKEAFENLRIKIFRLLNTDTKIKEFREKFNNYDKYDGDLFYEWHNLLTGSCKTGRDNFIKNHGINLKEKYTVNEFIKICENEYGSEIIKKLKEEFEC